MELFQLLGTIAIDNTRANSEIDETTGHAQKAESKISSAFKKVGKVVAAAFATGAIVNFGKKCVESAATAKALNSQFDQVFGNMKDSAADSLSKVADETGIMEERLKGSFTQIAAFAKTTGMDTADALGLTERATLAAADSAAYYDRSIEEVTENLQSFLKGNYENDAALGLSCTETTRNAAANKLYGKSFNELSESQKQLTLMQMVEDANELSGAMGQAAREADGWENVTGNLKESLNQLMVVLGTPILEAVVPIIQKVSEAFGWLNDNIRAVMDGEKTLAEVGSQMFTAIISGITQGIPQLANKAVEIIDKLGNGLSTNTPKLLPKVVQIITALVNAIVNNLPKIVAAGAKLVLKLAEGLIKSIPSLVKQIPQLIKAVVNALKNGNETITSTGKMFVQWLWNGIKSLMSWIGGKALSFAKSIPKKIKEGFVGIGNIGVDLVKGLWNGIGNMAGWIKSKIQGFGKGVLDALKSFFGIHSPSKVMEDQIGKQLALGVANGITKNKNYAKKSAAELGQLIVEAAATKLDKYKTYNNMTLAAEVEFWNQIRKQCKKGTDARLQADKEYFAAKKDLNEQLKSLEDEYLAKIEAANQKIADRANELLNAFSLFDEFSLSIDEENPLTSDTLLNNLSSQVDALDDWANEMSILKGKIGDTDLYAAVQEMGVNSLQQVKVINSMTEEQLNKYVELYNKRAEIAKEQATSELGSEVMQEMTDAYKDYETAVTALGATVKKKYTVINEVITETMTAVDSITSTKLANMDTAFKSGVQSMLDNVSTKFSSISSKISSTMSSAVATVRAAVAEMNAALASVNSADTSTTATVETKTTSNQTKVKKNAAGGILTKPTIFGYTPSSNTFQMGGEAGDEAIAPIDTLKGYVAEAVASQNGELVAVLQSILKAIKDQNLSVSLDGKEIANNVNKRLGVIY